MKTLRSNALNLPSIMSNIKTFNPCHPEGSPSNARAQSKDPERASSAMLRQGILTTLFLLFTFLFATTLYAQEHDHGAVHAANATPLAVTSKVPIPAEASRPVYKPARCDEQGNIYFRAYQSEERKVPVVRVDSRADRKGSATRYSLDSDPAFATATAYDFSVLPNGNLYQPVQLGKDVYIVAYDNQRSDNRPSDNQGAIRWKARLEKQFWVSRLIAFDDSKFLVIGTEPQSPNAPTQTRTYQPVVAIFDAAGRLVGNVSLESQPEEKPKDDKPKDEKPKQPGAKPAQPDHQPDQPTEKKTSPPLLAVLSSDGQASPGGRIYLQVGTGGRVYLMVHSEPPVVYAINSLGSVVGTWEITPPAERMAAISMSLGKNQIAVQFRHSFQGMSHGEDIISVFNLNGEDPSHPDPSHPDPNHDQAAESSRFSVPQELSSSVLGCFVGNDAVFVGPNPGGPDAAGSDGKWLVIQHATAGSTQHSALGTQPNKTSATPRGDK